MQAILPIPPTSTASDAESGIQNGGVNIANNVRQNLETYAKKVESDIYELADSKVNSMLHVSFTIITK